jgi:hypothetical protein
MLVKLMTDTAAFLALFAAFLVLFADINRRVALLILCDKLISL